MAVARVRGARAARVVAVTGAVDFALNDDAVTAVAVMTGDKQSEKTGDEEEDAVPEGLLAQYFLCSDKKNLHNAERKRRLEHSALPVNVQAVAVAGDVEQPQISAIRAVRGPVGAVCIGDATQTVDAADECANEEKVDEGDEFG